ncbi:MAG: hypothetical protein WKG32_01720 [Gemmatimonadaceae bacterium]
MRVFRMLVPLAALALGALPSEAQVGHPPQRSPYRDLTFRQEFSLFSGYYSGAKGRARVAPASGPMVGLRYEVRIGGPAEFTVRLARVWSERLVRDPNLAPEARDLGIRAWPLYVGDAGITLNLTGQKSYWGLVPVVHGGVGLATDFGKAGDPGGFKFGTPFAISFGGGVRWVPGGQFQLRADLADFFYQLEYPDAYFTPVADVAPILSGTAAKGEWKHNLALTVGASYLFFR